MRILRIVAVLALVSGLAAGVVSDDYKQGYKDAAGLYKSAGYMEGLLATTKLTLDMMDDTASEFEGTTLGAFAEGFVEKGGEVYNGYAREYNAMIPDLNAMTELVFGPDYDDSLRFERAPLFY